MNLGVNKLANCNDTKKEVITVLNRRIVLPFYIPVVSLICSFLLIKARNKRNYFLNKYSIFFLSFITLLYAELIIRYTGISKFVGGSKVKFFQKVLGMFGLYFGIIRGV